MFTLYTAMVRIIGILGKYEIKSTLLIFYLENSQIHLSFK